MSEQRGGGRGGRKPGRTGASARPSSSAPRSSTRDPQSHHDEPRGQRPPGNPRQGFRQIVEFAFGQICSSLGCAYFSSSSCGLQLQEPAAKTRDVYSGVLLRRADASRDACRSNVQMRCTGGHHHPAAKSSIAAPLRDDGIWGDQEHAASAAEDDPCPRSGLAPVSWRGESLGSCYLI